MSYTGNKPELSVLDVQTFVTDGVQGTFELNYKVGGPEAVDVYVNNQWQEPHASYGVIGKSKPLTSTVRRSVDPVSAYHILEAKRLADKKKVTFLEMSFSNFSSRF